MKQPINVVYNPIILNMLTINTLNIQAKTINGIQYLVNEKNIKKARIELRAKIPIQDLTIDNEVYEFYELPLEIQEKIKNKLIPHLVFSSQEIYLFCCILHLYLSNCTSLDIDEIHKNIRHYGNINLEKDKDITTLVSYKRAIKKLEHKILHIEIDKCNPRLYGLSNKRFTQNSLEIEHTSFRLGSLGTLIVLSEQYSDEHLPYKIFECRLNQIAKFILAYIVSYEIYSYKRKNPHIQYFEVKMSTLMKKIPYFSKNGNNSAQSIYHNLQKSKSKTQLIKRFFQNCCDVLELYEKENIISSYQISPNIERLGVNNYDKIKFCLNF